MAAIAAHPELTKTILELDEKKEEQDGLATPLTEEEMREYVPLSAEEIDSVMDVVQDLGLKM